MSHHNGVIISSEYRECVRNLDLRVQTISTSGSPMSSHINAKKINKKLALNSGIQTNQILTNDDEVCIPRLSGILLAVKTKL